MKKKTGINLLTGAYTLMILAMFLLPAINVPDHYIFRNTLSDLGAQHSAGAWIMNSIFAALAISSVISGWGCTKGFIFQRIILSLFGISLILSALFNQAPVNPGIQYDISEAGLHLYFACTTRLTFILLAFSTLLMLEKRSDRILAFVTGVTVMLLAILASEADHTAGIWDRLMFITTFGWMIYTYKTMDY